jgi:hypothetical protein
LQSVDKGRGHVYVIRFIPSHRVDTRGKETRGTVGEEVAEPHHPTDCLKEPMLLHWGASFGGGRGRLDMVVDAKTTAAWRVSGEWMAAAVATAGVDPMTKQGGAKASQHVVANRSKMVVAKRAVSAAHS